MRFPIRVTDVMSSPVQTTTPGATAATAAEMCEEAGIGSVVVVDDGHPVGIITSSDFVRVLGTVSDPGTRHVREFMSSPVVTIESDASIQDAVETMRENDVSRLVVLDDDSIGGIITTDDVAHVTPQILHRRDLPKAEGTHQYRVRQDTAYENEDWEVTCLTESEDRVTVGDTIEFTKRISEQDVRTFAAVSGDTNRLHLDEDFAAGTRFKRRIVHGTLVSGLISAALARLPGLTIYVSQDLSFLAPIDIGDRVTAVCTVVESHGNRKYTLTTDVFDEDGTQVIEGEAVVLIDRLPEVAAIGVEAIS
jgi:acyl dehydratase/CBS domain-containing protein